jgi:glycosyltransferase involved in cell wall biosynthesis
MKILYINYLYDLTESSVGASVHVNELARSIEKFGHNIEVYYLNQYNNETTDSVKYRIRSLLKSKLGRYLNQINALLANIKYFIKEWKIVCRERPDVLLVRYTFLNFSIALIAIIKKIPFILEVNAPIAYESRKFANQIIKLPFIPEFLEKFNLLFANEIIVVSEELKKYYMKWNVSEKKIHVIPNGVDDKLFTPDNNADRINSQYNLKGKTVFGFVGSFHYWHGVENLIWLIKTIWMRYKDTTFLLIGEGPLKNRLQNMLKEKNFNNNVIFTGYVPHKEIPEYLASMDIVLAPYPKLDFFYYSPLKLYEYMAAGKAIITSRIGQIESVITNLENGILTQPGNFTELAEKSFDLIENVSLRKKLGKCARKTILNTHTWIHTANTISKLLFEVVNKENTYY